MTPNSLTNTLLKSVVILAFVRRSRNKGQIRQMLCTKSPKILESLYGKALLRFHRPKHSPNFNADKKNLVVAWDILIQDYRLIPCESVEVVKIIPEKEFWDYYDNVVRHLNLKERNKFMNNK